MKNLNEFKDVKDKCYTIKRHGTYLTYSDTIYTFDIEVTSLFEIDGKYRSFDYSKNLDFYRDRDKVALPYIFMFGVEDDVFYSRNFYDIADILTKISSSFLRKIIYCHNLSYEFHFLINVIKSKKWHISDYILRGARKIITFVIDELNIEFRCSYALTNLSLDNCAKEYKCKTQKLIGNLDYTVSRSPLTVLTQAELQYCENDISVMYEFLSFFRDKYSHLCEIPLTQTGEMRRSLNQQVDYAYHKERHKHVPSLGVMSCLMAATQGGITHANPMYVDCVVENVGSWDYSSDYPYQMCTQKFPKSNFFRITEYQIDYFKSKCCIIYVVKLHRCKSKYANHYLSASKCNDLKKPLVDNGRLVRFDEATICVTDIDFELICKSYSIDKIDYIAIYASFKSYLDTRVVNFILNLYNDKTSLKGIENKYDIYMKSKQIINSCYGCAVTNVLKQRYDLDLYSEELFFKNDLSKEFIEKKLSEMRSSYSLLFDYAVGVWVTAHARRALWELVMEADRDCVYYDTDSVKLINFQNYDWLISSRNELVEKSCRDAALYHNIPFDKFCPSDCKGERHLLGTLEFEGVFDKFKTLGAKKYVTETAGNLSLTLSGVKKSAVKMLKSIDDFTDGLVFGYECDKLSIIYNNNQQSFGFTDIDGNFYECTDIKYAIVSMPTQYKLSIFPDLDTVLDNIELDIAY